MAVHVIRVVGLEVAAVVDDVDLELEIVLCLPHAYKYLAHLDELGSVVRAVGELGLDGVAKSGSARKCPRPSLIQIRSGVWKSLQT